MNVSQLFAVCLFTVLVSADSFARDLDANSTDSWSNSSINSNSSIFGDFQRFTSPLYLKPTIGGRVPNNAKWAAAYDKARTLVSQMSIPQKVNLTTGTGWTADLCVGNTGSVSEFGIPALCLQDGPLGVRFTDFVSAYPAGITAGSTFNKHLIAQRGTAMAREFKNKGVHVVLGPAVGPLGRNALGGRIWEGFGSDPYLQGVAARLTVRSIQNEGLIATVKHFIGNEQEHFRQVGEYYGPNQAVTNSVSSNIDDRALHEVYLWPFADCVNEGVGSVMCSYNRVNNTYACENSYLMNKILKEELGFEGFVQSDWWAMKTGLPPVQAGLDMAMPGDSYYFGSPETMLGSKLTKAVAENTIPDWRLNDMVTRILAAYFYVGLDKNTVGGPNFSSWTKETEGLRYPITGQCKQVVNKHVDVMHNELSKNTTRQVATEAIVLLKNSNGLLPLKGNKKPKSINIFGLGAAPGVHGANCRDDMACSDGALAEGWGSGSVQLPYFVSPYEAITERARALDINYDYDFTINDFSGFDPKAPNADVNLIFAVSDSGEGFTSFDGNWGDRNNASLWHNADEIILRAVHKNANNVVIISSVGPVNVEKWIEHPNVRAVLFTTPGGQDAGHAISDVLFGDANPSGKLPFTIAKNDNDYIPVVRQAGNGNPQAVFSEGVFIDYKLFDKNGYEPRFEFGYGLSYSTFGASNLKIRYANPPSEHLPAPPKLKPVVDLKCVKPEESSAYTFAKDFAPLPRFIYPWVESGTELHVNTTCEQATGAITEAPLAGGGLGGNPALWEVSYRVSVTASNTGPVAGAYAYQMYVEYPQNTKYNIPIRQLRGFEKPYLEPGDSAEVEFEILRRDLSVWDVEKQSWVVPRGEYKIWVARSSRNLIASVGIQL